MLEHRRGRSQVLFPSPCCPGRGDRDGPLGPRVGIGFLSTHCRLDSLVGAGRPWGTS